jgi:hypothetical protein
MTDARQQVQRVLADADRPADATEEEPLSVETPPDRSRQFRYTNFSRMRLSYIGDDQVRLDHIRRTADQAIQARFNGAFSLMDRLYRCVREPVTRDGEVVTGSDGRPIWQADEDGNPAEDWSLLGEGERSNFLFAINTHLFGWEQEAVDLWAEAMYAKVMWEEQFANAFIKLPGVSVSGKPTIDDRTQAGHAFSAQDRYFAVYCAALSRKAEAVVRSMNRLQRMLENTTAR